MKYPVKVLLDEKKQPFLPFTTTECVLVDGTEMTMTAYLMNYIAQKDKEIQDIIDELESYTERRIAELDTVVNNKIKEMENKINASISTMQSTVNNNITNMNGTIDTNTAAMVKHIEDETAALDARLAAKEAELDASVETMVTYRDETTTNVNSLETEVEGMRVDLGYAQDDLAALTTLEEGDE